MKHSLFIFFSILSFVSISQNDTINKFSKNGKKNGYWQVYLDEYLNPVDSVENSYFYAYERYDEGKVIFKFYFEKNQSSYIVNYRQPLSSKGKPIILNDTIDFFDNSYNTIVKHFEFAEGKPLFFKYYQYYASNPEKCGHIETMDWRIKYCNMEGSYYYQAFWDDQLLVEGWYKKVKNKWRLVKEKTIKNSGLIVY